MPQTDPAPPSQHQTVSRVASQIQYQQNTDAYDKFLEQIIPWLFEVGSWIFGGLIAFNVLLLASLITIGPAALSIKIATAALALALPLNVTGLVLLKLVQDLKHTGFDGIAQSFPAGGRTTAEQQIPTLTPLEALRKRGTRTVLSTTLGILGLSGTLTLTGIMAALWYMAWWIGVAFLAMVVLSLVIVQVALVTSRLHVSAEEKAQRKRYGEELIRQARERSRQAKIQR